MKRKMKLLQTKESVYDLIKIICAFLFPLVVCLLHCWRLGGGLWEVYLPNSQNNDDLFYFKQVQGVIEYGFPQGFFGFNESHASSLSFAAWSPLTLLVWVIWGKIFGWSISGYYWCNIVVLSASLAFFVNQARPKVKQMVAAGVLLLLFPGLAKYTLSCLVEAHMISYLILYYGMALGYVREQKNWKIIGMLMLSFFLTCIRPYMVLFVILPGIFLFARKKWVGIVSTVGVSGLSVISYFLITKNYTAPYFTPLFDDYMFKRFAYEGFYAGARYLVLEALKWMKELGEYMVASFTTGKFMGSNYCVLFLICIVMVVMVFLYRKKMAGLTGIIYIHFVCSALISVGALLVIMGKMNEGSRHILAFIVVGCILVSYMQSLKNIWQPFVVSALILFLFYYYPDDGQDYQIPLRTEERYEEQLAWEQIAGKVELIPQAPSYENTVIWAFSDIIDGEYGHIDWQPMLALPEGVGISCCDLDYITCEFEELKSRYIMTASNGKIAGKCEETQYEMLGSYDGIVLYRRK